MLPLPCMLVCIFVCANRTRDRGCSKHPVFPAPSLNSGGQTKMQTSGEVRRENANLYPRHCERSEAIHLSPIRDVDCFASLAMTWIGSGTHWITYRRLYPVDSPAVYPRPPPRRRTLTPATIVIKYNYSAQEVI